LIEYGKEKGKIGSRICADEAEVARFTAFSSLFFGQDIHAQIFILCHSKIRFTSDNPFDPACRLRGNRPDDKCRVLSYPERNLVDIGQARTKIASANNRTPEIMRIADKYPTSTI